MHDLLQSISFLNCAIMLTQVEKLMKMIVFLFLFVLAGPIRADEAEKVLGRALEFNRRSAQEDYARKLGVSEKEIAISRLYNSKTPSNSSDIGAIFERQQNEEHARRVGVDPKDIGRSRLYESSGTLSPADAAMLDSMMKIFRDER